MLLDDHPPWLLVPLGHLALVTVPLAVTDVRTHRLPNVLVLPGLLLLGWALVGCAVLADVGQARAGLAGAIVAGLVLGTGRMLGAVGMGDVKLGAWLGGLAGMMGAFEHPGAVAHGLVMGSVLTTALVTTEIAARPRAAVSPSGEPHPLAAGHRIPFGPPLLLAFWGSLAAAVAAA